MPDSRVAILVTNLGGCIERCVAKAFHPALLRWIAFIVLLPVAASPLWLPLLPPEGVWVSRAMAMIGTAAIAVVLTANRPRLMLVASPPFVTALLALTFYSLVPAIYADLALDGPLVLSPEDGPETWQHRGTGDTADVRTSFAVASPGEMAVLSFIGILLIAVLLFDRAIGSFNHRSRHDVLPVSYPLALISGAGVLFQLGKAITNAGPIYLNSFVDALPAVTSFGMALLVWRALEGPRNDKGWTIIGLLGGCLLMFPYQMKSMALFIATSLLCAALVSRGAIRGLLLILLVASPFLAAAAKQTYVYADVPSSYAVMGKLVSRQSESVYCLNFALREAFDGDDSWSKGPFYFVVGLVPRILWPDKPSASEGHDYFGPFCGNEGPAQSSSITLIGEPALRGGAGGLIAAATVLIALMGLAFAAWKRGTTFIAAAALGLSPWLIDFDQIFTLYLGLLVKNAIAVLAIERTLTWLSKKRARTRSAPAISHPKS